MALVCAAAICHACTFMQSEAGSLARHDARATSGIPTVAAAADGAACSPTAGAASLLVPVWTNHNTVLAVQTHKNLNSISCR
jgi:hypothetical protein